MVGRVLCGVLVLVLVLVRGAGWKQGGSLWKWEREQKKGHQSCSAQKGVRA